MNDRRGSSDAIGDSSSTSAHSDSHDPLLDYRRCNTCYQALTMAWVKVTGMPTDDMEMLIATLRLTAMRLADDE